jgi:hypothetical protein|tara:strand:+ start:1900 stop:2112 length:213 start_codon:yes stop_codon:yes gene_type:complete
MADGILEKVNAMTLSDALGAILAHNFTDAESSDVADSYRKHLVMSFDDIQEFLMYEVNNYQEEGNNAELV